MNTSLGYHTFAFFQKLSEEEYNILSGDFISYRKKNKDIKGFPVENKRGEKLGWEYTHKNDKGIRWLLVSSKGKNNFYMQGVMVVVNPKVLIEGNYITAAQEDDLKEVERIYNAEVTQISPILLNFGLCSMNRADHCINIDLEELGFPCTPKEMMTLIKKGDIPKHYIERKEEYDEKQRRKVADKHSFYLENGSCVINYYWKYPQQCKKTHPNFLYRESSRNVIRLEVQCKYLKLYSLAKKYRQISKFYVSDDDITVDELYDRMFTDAHSPSIPIDAMLSSEVSEKIIRKYFYKIIRKGDYFTMNGARQIVELYGFKRSKKERIIDTLKRVEEHRGIARAKATLYGSDLDKFNRSLKDLDNMLINPVTIPRRWGIKHIPNLLRAYDDMNIEEEIMPEQEYMAWKHIAVFLAK